MKQIWLLGAIAGMMLLFGCEPDCPKIKNRADQEEIIKTYLSHPVVDQSMDFDGRMMVFFTNTSDCYVFEITKVGIYYMRPWDRARKSKHIDIVLSIPPNDTRSVEIPVPMAANILSAFSLMENTKAKEYEKY